MTALVKRRFRSVARFLLSAVVGLMASIALALTLPQAFGYRAMTIMSGSMEPVLPTGAVVLQERIDPLDARVGDIVTFQSPEADVLMTHRVRDRRVIEGRVNFITKGDANNTTEEWTVPVDGSLGRVEFVVPGVGYLLVWTRTPAGRIALVGVPAILLGAIELVRIWRPRRNEDQE